MCRSLPVRQDNLAKDISNGTYHDSENSEIRTWIGAAVESWDIEKTGLIVINLDPVVSVSELEMHSIKPPEIVSQPIWIVARISKKFRIGSPFLR